MHGSRFPSTMLFIESNSRYSFLSIFLLTVDTLVTFFRADLEEILLYTYANSTVKLSKLIIIYIWNNFFIDESNIISRG